MTESVTETTSRKVAVHELLAQDGSVVESEEEADGIRYTLLGNGEKFDWLASQATPSELKLLAIFGAKTLATNETSQARNNPKGAASPDEQIGAVRDRFAMIRTGQWVDRTREGGAVGAKVDKDALAEAIVRVKLAAGKITDAQVGDEKAAIRQRLEDDVAYMRKARQVPEVASEYASIVGRATASVDDL